MQNWTLYLSDCAEQLQHIASDSVDLVVTSPPYTNQRSDTYGGVTPDGYVEWFLPIADELQRVLKPTGTFVLNIKERVVKGERHTYVLELILAMRQRGWLWTEEFIWHKKNCYPGKWPNRFRDAWERLLQFNLQRKFKMNQDAVMVPVGDWYESRMRTLSETDRARDESKVGSGFGKKVANWLDRDKVYPHNVLHRATECSNRPDSLTLLLSAGRLIFNNSFYSSGCQPSFERWQALELEGDTPFEPSEAQLKHTQFAPGARIDSLSAGGASPEDLFAYLVRP